MAVAATLSLAPARIREPCLAHAAQAGDRGVKGNPGRTRAKPGPWRNVGAATGELQKFPRERPRLNEYHIVILPQCGMCRPQAGRISSETSAKRQKRNEQISEEKEDPKATPEASGHQGCATLLVVLRTDWALKERSFAGAGTHFSRCQALSAGLFTLEFVELFTQAHAGLVQL